ncbi:MAG: quinol:cytochrome C oxidoreductase, partial [Bacteroidota bacterium]
HWAHHGIAEEFLEGGQPNPEYDPIIASKVPYLNVPFMAARMAVFFGLWILLYRAIRKHSLLEDQEGGLLRIRRIKTLASIFLPVFAVTWAMSTWDHIMSIDTHWYSTIFWVYH